VESPRGKRRHGSSTRHEQEERQVSESTSGHGRHHRHSQVTTVVWPVEKGHAHETSKAAIHKEKEGEEEEAIEPAPIHVESESMARAYARYDSGVNKRLNHDYAGAITELKEARQIFHEHELQESPMETFAALELGRTADEAGNYALARRTYEDLKGASPSSLGVRLTLAKLEAKHGEITDALREAREAVNLDPTSAEAHLMLSLILDRAGSVMEAVVEKQRAAELAGGHL